MADIVVRPYEDRDEEGYYSVLSLTYNDGLPIATERRTNIFGGRYVAEAEGQIAGIFSTLDMSLSRGQGQIACAGVGAVGVSPDLRRGGVGVQMMRWSIRHFKESGFPMAALYAFREPFYAKAGYVTCGKRLKLSVPTHRLPKIESDLPVRRLSPKDWRELERCFALFAHSRSGTNIRSERMWQRVLAEDKQLTIYAAGDPVQGYIAVSHTVRFWEEQWLSEVVWSSQAGYEACLGIMHRLGINKSGLGWFEPSDSPFYSLYLDQGVTAELVRPAMFRACDIKGCLQALRPNASGSFSIAIEDDQVPENNGPWKVEFVPGEISVSKAALSNCDLEMGIHSFTQALLGEPSLSEISKFGGIKVNSLAGLAAASQLMPASPVYLSDFF